MTKVLLIHPEIRAAEPPNHAPYGLLQLAALTDSLGMHVAVFDNNAFRLPIDAVRQTVKEEQWDVIGIGGLTTQYKAIKKIVPICREEHPAAVIVLGGGFLTEQPFDMMRWLPEADIGCIGESIITWAEILEHLNDKNWGKIKGLVYREGKKIKLSTMRPLIEEYYYCEEHKQKHYTFDEALKHDFQCPSCHQHLINNLDEEIPFPAYEFSPVETYLMYSQIPYSPESMMQGCRRLDVLSGYGCPWRCNFCSHNGASAYCQSKIYNTKVIGPEFRKHSPQYVADLITHLRMTYGINFISFIDENLTVNRKWFFKFCEKLEETGLATLIHWGMVCHSRTVDAELLHKAKDVGCTYISYGGETASEKLLKQIGKGQTKEIMTAAIEATQSAGMNPIMSFIVGFPKTTIDDLSEDCQFFIDNQVHVIPFFLQPYPGSELYSKYKDKIIEQWLTDVEKAFLTDPTPMKYAVIFERETSQSQGLNVLSQSQLQKNLPMIKEKIRDIALERWVSNLDDATKFSVNLTDFNDIELAGLRYFMSTWDVERLKKFKKELEAKKHE